jgi:hypothetical protein
MARTISDVGRARIVSEIKSFVRELRKALLDPYRPELHYMRGRGPRLACNRIVYGGKLSPGNFGSADWGEAVISTAVR